MMIMMEEINFKNFNSNNIFINKFSHTKFCNKSHLIYKVFLIFVKFVFRLGILSHFTKLLNIKLN